MNNYASMRPYELKIAGSSDNYTKGFVVYKSGSNTRVMINDLPTSASGLAPGSLWRDGNTVKIV